MACSSILNTFTLNLKIPLFTQGVALQFSIAMKNIIYNSHKYINWRLLFWSTEGRKNLFPSLAQKQPLK